MPNDFFDFTPPLTRHSLARAEAPNALFAAVEAGFDKLPDEDVLKEDRVTYATTGGGSNVYTVTSNFPISAYTEGFHARIKFHAANSGPATINFDAVGAIAMKRPNGEALAANDLPELGVVDLTFNGTEFRMNASISVATAGEAQIGAGAVTETKIATNAVTEGKIANDSVSAGKIASAALKAIAALTPAADVIGYFTGAASAALTTITAFGRTLIGAADAAAGRTALGLGTAAVEADTKYAHRANNLSDVTAATARSNLSVYSAAEVDALVSGGGTPVGKISGFACLAVPSGWLECNGQNVSRATYAALFAALRTVIGTATMTIATPGVVTKVAHGLVANQRVVFTTTGALPTGVTAGNSYYIISTGLTADAFRFSTTLGGSAVNTTGSQSGVHTLTLQPWGEGDGSTTFTLPDRRRKVGVGAGGSATSTLGASIGMSGGAETHTLTTPEMPAHTHPYDALSPSAGSGFGTDPSAGQNTTPATGSTGGGGAHNNMQPSSVELVCIKY